MKALCSIGSGLHEALLAISRPTFAAYAERHGYDLITSTESDPRRRIHPRTQLLTVVRQ